MDFYIWLLITLSVHGFLCRQIVSLSDDEGQELECGVVKYAEKSLIKNGYNTQPGQWPWHVAIFQNNNRNSNFVCGGTLINHYFVLTAAHCVVHTITGFVFTPQKLSLELGRYDLQQRSSNVQYHGVYEIIKHESYTRESHKHDLALIWLETRVNFTPYIQPICLFDLVDFDIESSRIQGTVVGWGATEHGETSSVLQSAIMPIVTFKECVTSIPIVFGIVLPDKAYCAGNRNGTTVCNGDSGGGMYHKLSGKWYLIGIVSFSAGKPCSGRDYAVFTNVNKYSAWIKSYIQKRKVYKELHISEKKCSGYKRFNSPTTNVAHLVLIGRVQSNKSHWFSGGTIISENFVISTSFPVRFLETLRITLNTVKIGIGMAGQATTVAIKEFIFHPNSQITQHRYYNVALVKLEERIKFNRFIAPACLSAEAFMVTNDTEIFRFDLLGKVSAMFRERSIKVLKENECDDLLQGVEMDNQLQEVQKCAYNLSAGIKLLIFDPNLLFTKVGKLYHISAIKTIETSFTAGSGMKITLFTDINQHLKWIESTIWGNHSALD